MGRECVAHYSTLHRFCVFSHDELVCRMAENSDKLDILVAAATYEDMVAMVRIRKTFATVTINRISKQFFESWSLMCTI